MLKILKKKKVWIPLVILLIGFGIFSLIRSGKNTIQVTEVPISHAAVVKSVSASGEIKAEKAAELAGLAGGTILNIPVQEGAAVTRGTLLAQFDRASLAASAQASKDARDIAIRNRDLFLAQYQ